MAVNKIWPHLKKDKYCKYVFMNGGNSNKLRNRNLIRNSISRKPRIEQYYTL